MPDMFQAVGGIFQGAGSIAGGIFSSEADSTSASMYRQAAQFEKLNTGLKLIQTGRQVYQALGTARADIASSGLSLSGSAANVMRASAQQGSLMRAMVGFEGRVQEQSYMAQAKAMDEKAQGDMISGILSGAGQIIGGFGGF